MSAASARQSQRVLIDAPVQLTLRDADRALPARALDLSEGGMRLSTDAEVQVGDEVTCDLDLHNEHAALRGKVRWSKPALPQPGAAGVGVQFGPLSDDQLTVLRRWLAHDDAHTDLVPSSEEAEVGTVSRPRELEAKRERTELDAKSEHTELGHGSEQTELVNLSEHAELVLLHVPTLREPLRARGSVGPDGLQLTAAMPQLAPGSELEFQVGEHGPRRAGKIEQIELKPSGAGGGFELALRLQPSAAVRSRRNLVYGLGGSEVTDLRAPSFAAGAPTDAGRTRLESSRRRTRNARRETMEIPKTGALRYLRTAGIVVVAAGITLFVWSRITEPAGSEREATRRAWVVEPKSNGPNPTESRDETTLQAATVPSPMAQPTVPPPPPAAQPAERVPTPSAAAPIEPTELAVAEASGADDVTSAGGPSTPAVDEARLPALNSFGSKSEIFVPMQGSLNGLRSTQWTDPLAVVLDLPNAHIDAPELLRGLRGGGVRRVRLDETRPVPRLHIYLNTVAARFAARSVPHGLLVVLEHDLRPLPR